MALVVRAFPVKDKQEVLKFVGEVKGRAEDARHFYEGFGVRNEKWFFQDANGVGPIVIGVTEVAEPLEKVAREFAARTRAHVRSSPSPARCP